MSDLEQYRQEIDELDEQLVRLFLRRMEVTGKVGEYKLAHGMQVLDRERERRVLAKRASLAVDIRQEEDVKELFQTIMAISRRRQQELIDRSGTGTVRKTNVVLIGMPGSGKSCVGAALAERLGMPLVETDAMVVEKTGRSIPDIFAQDGEAAFRREDTAAALLNLFQQETEAMQAENQKLRDDLQESRYDCAMEQASGGLRFSSQAAKQMFFNRLREAQLPMEDGALQGFSEFQEEFQRNDPGAFRTGQPVIVSGTGRSVEKSSALRRAFGLK